MDQSNKAAGSPSISSLNQPVAGGDTHQNSTNNDLNISNTSIASQSDQNQSTLAQPPISQPGKTNSPAYDPQAIVVQGDTTAVPKETIGFSQVEEPATSTTTTPAEAPIPPVQAVAPLEDLPSMIPPSSDPGVATSAPPMDAVQAPVTPLDTLPTLTPTQTPAPPSPDAKTDSEKSPLEILEEILAEANTEKSKEEDAKQKKEREDKEFAEQMAAKEAAFQQQAALEIDQKRQEVEEAKTRRDDVEADLQAQGKGNDQAPDVTDDALVIHQLEHDKVQ